MKPYLDCTRCECLRPSSSLVPVTVVDGANIRVYRQCREQKFCDDAIAEATRKARMRDDEFRAPSPPPPPPEPPRELLRYAGTQHGRLLVLEDLPREGKRVPLRVRCRCGKEMVIERRNLKAFEGRACMACKSQAVAR